MTTTENKTQAAAASILKRNGKLSFWFASLFLPRRITSDAARLYAFCRTMDDLADIAVTESKREKLAKVRQDLRRGTSSNPDVSDFLALARNYHLPLAAADYLISTFLQDATTEVHLEDEAALVRYCYGVAGTVGLMMPPILGADPRPAGEAAVHLGIAMQMNEDRSGRFGRRRQRTQVPAWMLGSAGDSATNGCIARKSIAGRLSRRAPAGCGR